MKISNNINLTSSYIAWDVETSGLNFIDDRILEIGAAKVIDGEIIERIQWVLQNNIEVPEFITEITGITNELIKEEGRDPKTCIEEFIKFLAPEGKFLPHLTHNGIKFDIPFLAEQTERILNLEPGRKDRMKKNLFSTAIDSAVLVKAKKLGMNPLSSESFKEWADRVMNVRAYGVKYSVNVCCEEMNIDRNKVAQHRALGDIELTNEIYKKMINNFNTEI